MNPNPVNPNPAGVPTFKSVASNVGGIEVYESDGYIQLEGFKLDLIQAAALRNKLTDWANAKRTRDRKRESQGN